VILLFLLRGRGAATEALRSAPLAGLLLCNLPAYMWILMIRSNLHVSIARHRIISNHLTRQSFAPQAPLAAAFSEQE
jgi:hypothetical protein